MTLTLKDAALRYATLGYPVLPISPGKKTPCVTNGLLEATTDSDQIEKWWKRWPKANVAIRCDGMIVVDIDPDGKDWLSDEPDKRLELAIAPTATTPRGKHHYFRAPPGNTFGNTGGRLAKGVDTRANGGYVLAEPSVFDKKQYTFIEALDCEPDKLPLPPPWLIDLLAPRGNLVSVRQSDTTTDCEFRDGTRNSSLAGVAGAMRQRGASESAILSALEIMNREQSKPPLDSSEVSMIAHSIARYEPSTISAAIAERLYLSLNIPTEPETSEVGTTPEALLQIPGFIDNVKNHILETAPYAEPTLAFGAALALQAFLASRKVRSPGNARPPLYIVTLANSASGKDWPRKIIQDVLESCGMLDCLGDSLGSGEGLEDLLLIKPQFILLSDEVNFLFESIKNGRDERYQRAAALLLSLFGEVDKKHKMRILKGGKNDYIDQPALTLFGTAIPGQLYGSISPRMLVNGLFARLLLLEAGKRGRGRIPVSRALPNSITSVAEYWAGFQPGGTSKNLAAWHPEPIVISQTSEAERTIANFLSDCDDQYAKAEARNDQAAMAVWGRTAEKANRLAVNHACSVNHTSPTIDEAAAQWACQFSEHQTRRMLFMAGQHVAENAFHAECQKMERVLREWAKQNPAKPMPSYQIKRRLRGMEPKLFDNVLTTLIEQGSVECRQTDSDVKGGRPAVGYLAIGA